MAINKSPSYRLTVFISLMFILLVSNSCQQKLSRPPLLKNTVITFADEFEKIANTDMRSMNSHDTSLWRTVLTDDVAYYEISTIPENVGIDNVITLRQGFFYAQPKIEYRPVEKYIDRLGGYSVWEMWNLCEKPCLEALMYTIHEGKVSDYWWLKNQNEFNSSVYTTSLQSYATAWSSGKPEEVAGLYDPDIIRQDTLFVENQKGEAAVKEFAENFFSWYPYVNFELGEVFELAGGLPLRSAGLYTVHIKDPSGQPCEIKAIIQLDTDILNDQIVAERLFYNADSLIACGWAQ
jgi:hypothetical protein